MTDIIAHYGEGAAPRRHLHDHSGARGRGRRSPPRASSYLTGRPSGRPLCFPATPPPPYARERGGAPCP